MRSTTTSSVSGVAPLEHALGFFQGDDLALDAEAGEAAAAEVGGGFEQDRRLILRHRGDRP
jgi:hypothetical protein